MNFHRTSSILALVPAAVAVLATSSSSMQAEPRPVPGYCHESSVIPRTADAAEHWLAACPALRTR